MELPARKKYIKPPNCDPRTCPIALCFYKVTILDWCLEQGQGEIRTCLLTFKHLWCLPKQADKKTDKLFNRVIRCIQFIIKIRYCSKVGFFLDVFERRLTKALFIFIKK